MRIMKNERLILLALVACLAGSALAQGRGRAQRFYDPKTEATVKGTVEKVTEITGKRGSNGIHLTLRTNDHTYDVHVGPSGYVSQNGFKFSAGDQVEVTGSVVGAEMMVAREIKKGGKVLTLRDNQGIPMWSGGRRRYY